MPYLEGTVEELFAAGLADTTRRTYRTGANRYTVFCSQLDVTAFLVSERSLSLFVAHLAVRERKASTAKSYLAAVRHSQIALGLGDPRVGDMPQLEYVLKGLKRRSASRPCRTRLPVIPDLMRVMKPSWEKTGPTHNSVVLWAASCLCFFRVFEVGGGGGSL